MRFDHIFTIALFSLGASGVLGKNIRSSEGRSLLVFIDSSVKGKCEGDCNTDADCATGLRCFLREGFETVPGCEGVGVLSMDYCVEATATSDAPTIIETSDTTTTAPTPTTTTTETSTSAPVGSISIGLTTLEPESPSSTNTTFPTAAPTPTTTTAPAVSTAPTMSGTESPTPAATASPVTTPIDTGVPTEEVLTTTPTILEVETSSPTSGPTGLPILAVVGDDGGESMNLKECEGDCDDDSECGGDLICFERSSGDEVPGCAGSAFESKDYCIRPLNTIAGLSFNTSGTGELSYLFSSFLVATAIILFMTIGV